MDKEFLNELFLELKQRLWDDCHFGLNDEIIEFSGDLDEYGMPKISSIKHRPIEELYEIVDFAVGQKQEIDNEYLEDMPEKFKYLTFEYCDQLCNGGYIGDEYYGYVYYPLPNGQYMKVWYEC